MNELKLVLSASLFMRGGAKSAIKTYCFSQGLECEVEEDKGFFNSDYYFRISGPSQLLHQASTDINTWLKEYDES
jgi:hypothetical protein